MALSTGENEKRQLASILKDRLIEGKNTTTYRELLEEEMPLFLKNFLQNRVKKYYVTDEPIQFKNSKRYDFNNERIKELKAQFRAAFEEATLFQKEEITEIINRTVGLQFDLLVSPRNTLATIFFKNKSERTQTEILQILSGLADKRVFIQQLILDLREFDQFHILREDFDKLAKQTQQAVFAEKFLTAIMSDIITYIEFVSHIYDKEINTIHKEILQLFLRERSYDNLCPAFENKTPDDLFDVDDIAALLTDFMDTNGKNDDANQYDTIEDDIEEFIVSAVETEPIESEPEPEPVQEEVQPDGTATEKLDTNRHFPVVEEWKDPQDIMIDRKQIESQPKGPLVALNSLIDEKSKKLIQKKIFDKDDIAYNNFIMRLESVDNWKEAKQIIDEELLIRAVQPFSKEALTLGDLVFNRYFPKKK